MQSQYPNHSASHACAGQSMKSRRHIRGIVASLWLALLVILLPGAAFAQGTPYISASVQLFDNNGEPCSSCKLYTYAAGTSTPLATYADSALMTANANPVVLNSAGRWPIFLSANSFKFVLKNSAETVTYFTIDNVSSIGLAANQVGFELVTLGGDPNVAITATSYPSGTAYATTVHAGTFVFSFNSANIPPGTYALEGMLLASGGTVTAALVNLSDGAPDTAMVTIASSSTTGERQISSGITFAAAGAAKSYAIKVKTSAGFGFCWALRLVRLS